MSEMSLFISVFKLDATLQGRAIPLSIHSAIVQGPHIPLTRAGIGAQMHIPTT